MHSKTSKGKLNKYSLVGIDRAISFVESTQPTVNYPNLDWSLDLDNIDIGEAQLATWAAESTTASLLLTGDKRFMKAIAIHQEANDIFSQLTGRVVCFEELVKHLIKHIGIDIVRKCVTNSPNCDGALSLVFGNRFDLPESQVIDGLDSMIQDIIKEVGATWLKCLS